jgi:pimeloyl-ACP methyl ester carboxylesterase
MFVFFQKSRPARNLFAVTGLLLWIALMACATADSLAYDTTGDALPLEPITAGKFDIMSWSRIGGGDYLRIYIEGDGSPASLRIGGGDPTPERPVSQWLAKEDTRGNVAYLARPCQFTPSDHRRGCERQYWGDARFNFEVISSMAEAVKQLARKHGITQIELVGYDGGGVVAALVALRIPEVTSVRTIGAPMDVAAWAYSRQMAPLARSLVPEDNIGQLAHIPQLHIASRQDEYVKPAVLESFMRRLPAAHCTELAVVDGPRHDGDWTAIWREYRDKTIACTDKPR